MLAACGALCAAFGVALSAYASHAAGGDDQRRLMIAAVFAFGHGLALAALSGHARGRFAMLPLLGMLLGTALFSGSLCASVWLGAGTGLAPFGGTLLIVSWLLQAIVSLRGR